MSTQLIKDAEFILDRYNAEWLDHDPKGWGKLDITVTDKETGITIGYGRNYSSMFKTFYPFMCNGKKLALVSDHYTRTAILDLESGEIIGGEEAQSSGFCPVDYYVPFVTVYRYDFKMAEKDHVGYIECVDNEYKLDKLQEFRDEYLDRDTIVMQKYLPFGFVAGCHWGDDSSDKIQMLDLSQADKGIIKRCEPFGYIEKSNNVDLRDAVNIMYDLHQNDAGEFTEYVRILPTAIQSESFIDIRKNDAGQIEYKLTGDEIHEISHGLASQPETLKAFKSELEELLTKYSSELPNYQILQ